MVARANFTTSRNNEDNYGHGTHVAGIVAATDSNGMGVGGVCPGCTILAGKILSDTGMRSSSGLANGINWAVQNGAQVINMSLIVGASITLETAVNNAWNAGVVLVAAAGNGNSTTMMYPGAYPNVIAVGATDNNDKKASFSTYGTWVDVAAPGVSVYSTFPNHRFVLAREYNRSQGYDIGSGTSMSSPIVAAVAALAWSANPGASNWTVREKVEASTNPIEGVGTFWTHGRVNADLAVHW
ncbi:S8 family serine peptidase [Pseudarthrobacter sp. fls2-241-R2A-168]|uniref:S8 family serine peptidase n=1 Tax=Pseudarthrobacter sp. fls2-241-R2A-168 TaxID=3040304 RepID=UPI003306417A